MTDRDTEIIEAYADGKTMQELAYIHDITRQRVHQILIKYDCPRRPVGSTGLEPDQVDDIRSLYRRGLPVSEIVDQTHAYATVKKYIAPLVKNRRTFAAHQRASLRHKQKQARELHADTVEMYERGMTKQEIADAEGVSPVAINKRLTAAGVDVRGRPPGKNTDRLEMLRRYETGESLHSIADDKGVCTGTIQHHLRMALRMGEVR